MHCISQTYLLGLILVVVTTWGEDDVLLATHLVLGLESGALITLFSLNKCDTFFHIL